MPIRQILYNKLQRRFGKVIIVHEGENMRRHYVDEGGGKPGGKWRMQIDSAGEYYRVNCPFCTDTRCRLWINHMWALADAKNPHNMNLWLCVCYNESCLVTYENQRALFNQLFDDTREIKEDTVGRGENNPSTMREANWPGASVPLEQLGADHEANLFLQEKGYDPVKLSREFDLRFCYDPPFEYRMAAARIIIPVVNRGKMYGWQGRLVGPQPAKHIPKYWTMPGMKKTQLLYNLDTAKQHGFGVLCEGPADVWRFGPEAMCVFGHTVSTVQGDTLNWAFSMHNKPIVVMFDGDEDARLHAEGYYNELKGKPRVLVSLPDDVDPGNYQTDEIRRIVFSEAARQGHPLRVS